MNNDGFPVFYYDVQPFKSTFSSIYNYDSAPGFNYAADINREIWRLLDPGKEETESKMWPSTSKSEENELQTQRGPQPHKKWQGMYCGFCKSAGVPPEQYTTHWVKDRKTGEVTCPILYEKACPYCKATGPNSHIKKFCPKLRNKKLLEETNRWGNFERNQTKRH